MLPLLPLLIAFLALALPAHADLVRVGGTGGSAPLLEKLAHAYVKANPGDEIRLVKPPLGSGGGLRALAAGKLDIAISGRAPTPEEQAPIGIATKWARTPLVLATSDGVLPAGFTSAALAEVYAGRQTRWPDGARLRLVLRSPFESDTRLLRELSPAMDQAMDVALARQGMVVAENDLETVDLLEKNPGSLGPTTLGLLRLRGSPLRVLALDGVAPSVQALAAGHYRLVKTFTLATGKFPTAATRRFLDFLHSAQARAALQSDDFLPAF